MSGISLSQRLWQIMDPTVQRAIDGLANTYDDTARKLNTAFDFSDRVLNVRLPMTAQSVSATSLASATGIKSVVGPWQKSSSVFPATPTALAWAIDNTATNTQNLVQGFIATHPGSIIGMQLAGLSTPAASITVTVFKNQVTTAATYTATLTTVNSYSYTTFAKGLVPFAAGDRLEIYYSGVGGPTGQLVASFTVEFSA